MLFRSRFLEAHLRRKLLGLDMQEDEVDGFDTIDTDSAEAIERAVPQIRKNLTMNQWQSHSPQQIYPEETYNDGANGVRTQKSVWCSLTSPRKRVHTGSGGHNGQSRPKERDGNRRRKWVPNQKIV
jgi:hypothetical protein